jgi:hypothetical protein
MRYFRPYLYEKTFTVVTEHKTLTCIMNLKDPRSRLLKWRIKLKELDYEVVYRKGALDTNADVQIRISIPNRGKGST